MARTSAAAVLLLAAFSFDSASAAISDVASGANPVRRVVSLLQTMAKKVDAEGKKEKDLYDKFMCYCRTSGGELAQSIAENNAKVPQVQSDIEAGQSELVRIQADLKLHKEDRRSSKAAMAAATAQRDGENKQFLETSGEYKSYISALEKAIPAIQKGMGGAFLQTAAGARLHQAISADSSVTDYDRQLVSDFLSGADAQNYAPRSGEIVGILNQINEDFKKSLADVSSSEEESVKLYDALISAKKKQVEALSAAIETKTVRNGELQVNIVNMKHDLSESEAALVEDQKFAADMEKNCAAKTGEWEERQKTRAEELVAIHETIKILNDDDALELFKKTLPSPSLLQLEASKEQLRLRALALIRGVRKPLHEIRPELDFMALALSGKKIDFSKVMKMIDDMVALLQQEQASDDDKKEYCAKEIDSAEDKVKEISKKVEGLDAAIADEEEAIAAMVAEVKELTKGVQALDKSVAEATEQRKAEHTDFQELMQSNSAAKEILQFAKTRLNKFYNPSLAPTSDAFVQLEMQHTTRDAPSTPPGTWDRYGKKNEDSAGVIGMINLLIRDLDKEMTEAGTQEEADQRAYETLMGDAAKKRASDLASITAKEKAKADYEEDKASNTASAKQESKSLMATKQYEMQLHQECDWLVQNFDLRTEARKEEISALKEAKAVLAGADFAFLQSNSVGKLVTRRLRGH